MASFDRLCNWSVTGHDSLVTSCHLPCRRPHTMATTMRGVQGCTRYAHIPFFFVLLTFSCRYRGLVAHHHLPRLNARQRGLVAHHCTPPPPPLLERKTEGPQACCPPPLRSRT